MKPCDRLFQPRFEPLACRKSLRALEQVVRATPGTQLTPMDRLGLAFTHGFGHGGTHLAFLFACWLPLTLGKGTYYTGACPQMPFFLAAALSAMAIFVLLLFSMVISFDALDHGQVQRAGIPAALHAAAALVTLGNFKHGGCMVTIPVLMVLAGVAVALALQICGRTMQEITSQRRSDSM